MVSRLALLMGDLRLRYRNTRALPTELGGGLLLAYYSIVRLAL